MVRRNQRPATLMGANVGFVVQNDANFEKGLTELREAHPSGLSWFGDHLPNQRNNWENDFTDFRNHFLEHRQAEP
jgi:hypothetical protein